jgi:Diguanylate cyclase, GGDEF domain
MGVYADTDAVSVTISIGIAVLGVHGGDLFELLAAADLALYQAKDGGRDRVCVDSPDRQPRLDSRGEDTPDPAALNQDAPEPGPAADTGGETGDSTG